MFSCNYKVTTKCCVTWSWFLWPCGFRFSDWLQFSVCLRLMSWWLVMTVCHRSHEIRLDGKLINILHFYILLRLWLQSFLLSFKRTTVSWATSCFFTLISWLQQFLRFWVSEWFSHYNICICVSPVIYFAFFVLRTKHNLYFIRCSVFLCNTMSMSQIVL